MNFEPPELIRENRFNNDIIIVDGQGRSGKNLIAILLSSISQIEKMRLDSQLDYVPRYFALGKMSKDAAIVALQTEFDEKYYYNSISRDVNFRFSDYSSVWKQGHKLKYFYRLFQPADEAALRRIESQNPIFQDMTHDALQVIEIFFAALNDRVKFIHVLRDPVGNIYEQNLRNFGERLAKDPREFQLTYLYETNIVPLMARGYEDLYINGNPIEKLIITVNAMFHKNMNALKSLDAARKSQIHFIDFDDFVINPFEPLNKLEDFIGKKFNRRAQRILQRENVPRMQNLDVRKTRIKEIEKQIHSEYQHIFEELISYYQKKPWEN
jgi:hypothetical protein